MIRLFTQYPQIHRVGGCRTAQPTLPDAQIKRRAKGPPFYYYDTISLIYTETNKPCGISTKSIGRN